MSNRITAVLFVLLLVSPGVGAIAVTAQEDVRDAELAIKQPHYVDGDVSVESHEGKPLYQVNGPIHRIQPQNFDNSRVIDFGLVESEGSLSYDDEMGTYVLDTEGNNATFRAYWIVSETRPVNQTIAGNETNATGEVETREVQVRYEAFIGTDGVDLTHIPPERLAGIEADAENWSDWESDVKSPGIAGEDADIQTQTNLALEFLALRHHPLDALTGDFLGLLIALTLSLSGLFLLGIFAGLHYMSRRGDIKELHEIEKLEAGEEEVVDRLNRMYEKERMAALENMDWQDIFPNDHIAQILRQSLGENPFAGFLKHLEIIGNVKKDRLKVMGESGYKAAVEWANGGESVNSARILGPDELALIEDDSQDILAENEELEPLDDPNTALVNAIEWDDPLLMDFDMASQELPDDWRQTELTSPTLDELIEELDVHIPRDFDTKQEFAQYYLEFLEGVRQHDFTDANGKPRSLRMTLNILLRLSRVLGDKNDVPMADWSADWIEMLLWNNDPEREIVEYVESVRAGKET